MSTWACLVCTYENEGSKLNCEICNSPSPTHAATETPSWICDACTFVVPGSDIFCSSCSALNPACAAREAAGEIWYCRACSMAAEPTEFVCSVCRTQRPKETYPMTHGLGNIRKTDTPMITARDFVFEMKETDANSDYGPVFIPESGPIDRPAVLKHILAHRIDLYRTLLAFIDPESGEVLKKPRNLSTAPATWEAITSECKNRFPDKTLDTLDTEQLQEVTAVALIRQLYGRLYETNRRLAEASKVVSKVVPKKSSTAEITFSAAGSAKSSRSSATSSEKKSTTPSKKASEAKSLDPNSCAVCYCEWDSDTVKVAMKNCGHENVCIDCFVTYLHKKIKESDVLPYLGCLVPNCGVCLAADDLLVDLTKLTPSALIKLARVHLSKMLSREFDFAWCQSRLCSVKCGAGILLKSEEKSRTDHCLNCGQRGVFKRPEPELDDTTKKMIAEGILRPCPQCGLHSVKEKGICNVIQCAGCNIWWNWKTRQTGQSSTELKNRARSEGSLWEPGELEYQQRLQYSDPEEFKALLERNGMKYDPNYRRGT